MRQAVHTQRLLLDLAWFFHYNSHKRKESFNLDMDLSEIVRPYIPIGFAAACMYPYYRSIIIIICAIDIPQLQWPHYRKHNKKGPALITGL